MTVGKGAMVPPNFFEIFGFSEMLMLRQKTVGLLLLVKTKISNFIAKSLNLAPLLYRYHNALRERIILYHDVLGGKRDLISKNHYRT